MELRSKLVTSMVFAVILALVFVFLWLVLGYNLFMEGIVSVLYYIAAFLLGLMTVSRTRGTIAGLTFGITTAIAKIIVWPYSGLIHINLILEATFIASLGGFYGYLNWLTLPLKRRGESGVYVWSFRLFHP